MTARRVRSDRFAETALPLVIQRIEQLRSLTYPQARNLPEVDWHDVLISGTKSSLTVFRQDDAYQLQGKTLVVVLAARRIMLGMVELHVERGLVFSPNEPVRDATGIELQNSGG